MVGGGPERGIDVSNHSHCCHNLKLSLCKPQKASHLAMLACCTQQRLCSNYGCMPAGAHLPFYTEPWDVTVCCMPARLTKAALMHL